MPYSYEQPFGNAVDVRPSWSTEEEKLLIEKFSAETEGYDLVSTAIDSLTALGAAEANVVGEIFATTAGSPISAALSSITGSSAPLESDRDVQTLMTGGGAAATTTEGGY